MNAETRVPFDWAAATQAAGNDSFSGDQYLVQPAGNRVLLAVVDGLGHGEKAAEVAELARALRTLAACVSPMMVEAAAQPSVGGGLLMPERFLIERRMERLEKALGRITLAGDTGSAAKGRAAR